MRGGGNEATQVPVKSWSGFAADWLGVNDTMEMLLMLRANERVWVRLRCANPHLVPARVVQSLAAGYALVTPERAIECGFGCCNHQADRDPFLISESDVWIREFAEKSLFEGPFHEPD